MDKTRKKILVVDDEQDIAEILQFNLRAEGYDVDVAFSAEELASPPGPLSRSALDACEVSRSKKEQGGANCFSHLAKYDLILLDVMMGEISGFGLARLLKKDAATAGIPIIFITALDGEEETVKGLDLGADDYIPKPQSMKEVKARVRAVLRRASVPLPLRSPLRVATASQFSAIPSRGSSEGKPVRLEFEGIEIDLELKSATVDGKAVTLTHLEFELLAFFLQHRGRVYSIFRNLIDNAIAYAGGTESTAKLSGTVAITVSAIKISGEMVEFFVFDNGVGVPKEHLSHLCERFCRIDKGRSRKLGGIGLGLAIVKNAVLLHHGEIDLMTTPCGGLTIRFTLPSA